jgi:hypothetical protein
VRLAGLALMAASAFAAAQGPASVAAPFEVVSAEFGLFNALETGRPPFIATPLVPLVVDQSYGWVIVLKTSAKTMRWREEFIRAMSDEGRPTITEREVTLHNGVIFNSWSVAQGDPAGTYRMRVSVEGKLVRTFEFRVE